MEAINTRKIHRIVKDLDINRIIIGLRAYDKDNNNLFFFRHKGGIGSKSYKNSKIALQISKLPHRKNSRFKRITSGSAQQLEFICKQ